MNQTLQLGDMQVDGPALVELCRRYSVKELSLFGSAVRGEMRPESDVDIMVEFEPGVRIGGQVRVPRRRVKVPAGRPQCRSGHQAWTEALGTPPSSQGCPGHLCGMSRRF